MSFILNSGIDVVLYDDLFVNAPAPCSQYKIVFLQQFMVLMKI